MESAYDNGLMDGYDDGYYDGYHDALVDNGLASDPPPTTTYADDEAPVEKHLSAGDIFGLEPYYIRRSEAEELWEKRQQE